MSEEVVEAEVTAEVAPKPKKKKKGLVIAGAVVAVVAVAVVGLLIWHEQPSFCNAICHTPMDPYLGTYEAEPGTTTIDKYGNECEASAMLAAQHRAIGVKMGDDITCMTCHVPQISEQISEGIEWITGNYEVVANDTFGVVVTEKTLKDLVAARGIASDEFCLNDGCHKGGRDALIARTSNYERNPHVAQHGTVECSDCHKAHRASTNYCQSCHSDAPQPEGWVTPAEAKKIQAK